MKIINKVVSIKDVAKSRDKLVKMFYKEKSDVLKELKLIDAEHFEKERFIESILDWCIEEINGEFDFDGDEEC